MNKNKNPVQEHIVRKAYQKKITTISQVCWRGITSALVYLNREYFHSCNCLTY